MTDIPVSNEGAIWVMVGTRPEVIKQAPVYSALLSLLGPKGVKLVGTGQHRELLVQALGSFDLSLDINLDLMKTGQTLVESSSSILAATGHLIHAWRPKCMIVQGDTTTAAMSAWAAFLSKVPVCHNEAGLRSYDLANPFPEEGNRKLISSISELHFAPTLLAKNSLISEGLNPANIFVTGNSGIDSLLMQQKKPCPESIAGLLSLDKLRSKKKILLTAHRRENAGSMDSWFQTLRIFLIENPDCVLIHLTHPNQLASGSAQQKLTSLNNYHPIEPLGYLETCHLLKYIDILVTDSGGLQEEGASMGVPVVVRRLKTERMEAVNAGLATLVGDSADLLLNGLSWAKEFALSSKFKSRSEIYGTGDSGRKIAELIVKYY